MSNKLEIKRIKAELMNVQAGRFNLELRIDEKLDEIERLKEHISISELKEKELIEKIKTEEGK